MVISIYWLEDIIISMEKSSLDCDSHRMKQLTNQKYYCQVQHISWPNTCIKHSSHLFLVWFKLVIVSTLCACPYFVHKILHPLSTPSIVLIDPFGKSCEENIWPTHRSYGGATNSSWSKASINKDWFGLQATCEPMRLVEPYTNEICTICNMIEK